MIKQKSRNIVYDNNVEFTDNDVLLYMLVDAQQAEQVSTEEEVNEVTEVSNNNQNRGFGIFRQFGIQTADIRVMRIIFHTTTIHNQGRGIMFHK
jgi:hypothetical protein